MAHGPTAYAAGMRWLAAAVGAGAVQAVAVSAVAPADDWAPGPAAVEVSGSGRKIDLMPRVLDRLMVCQAMMLSDLTYFGSWPPPEVTRAKFRELCNHPAVIGAGLQLLAAACVDMHGTFKQQQQKWRQQKAALKAAAAGKDAAGGKGKKKRRGAEANPLLKLNLPPDHAEAGVSAGWEQGLGPWRREHRDWVPGEGWTLAAGLCGQAEVLFRNHYVAMLHPDSWEPRTVVLMEKTSDEILSVHLARLPVMKLLLEVVFLLQATAPGVGVHLEVGRVLFMTVRDNPVAARELLRQRGLLLLQAMQLMDPEGEEEEQERGLYFNREKARQMPGGGMDWLESLVASAAECSKYDDGWVGG